MKAVALVFMAAGILGLLAVRDSEPAATGLHCTSCSSCAGVRVHVNDPGNRAVCPYLATHPDALKCPYLRSLLKSPASSGTFGPENKKPGHIARRASPTNNRLRRLKVA